MVKIEDLTQKQEEELYKVYLKEDFCMIMTFPDFIIYAEKKGMLPSDDRWEQLSLDI